MGHGYLLNNTNRLDERFLCLIYWDKHSSYEDLAEKDRFVSIHTFVYKELHFLPQLQAV